VRGTDAVLSGCGAMGRGFDDKRWSTSSALGRGGAGAGIRIFIGGIEEAGMGGNDMESRP
jgi:hypothetical protein